MTQYEIVSEFNEMSLRIDHDVNSTKIEPIMMQDTILLADLLWIAPADGTNLKAGDIWAHIVSVNQVPKDGWVAVKHLDVVYCTYRDTALPAPTQISTENVDKPLLDSQLAGVVTVRKWGDKHLYDLDGMSTGDVNGNFQEVPLFTPDKNNPKQGSFNAISSFQELGKKELEYLKIIQPNDSSKYGLKQKIGWLIQEPPINGTPGQIYWSKKSSLDDPNITFCFGTLVFGGQKVLVETDAAGHKMEYKFSGRYRAKKYKTQHELEMIPFYKIIGMRKTEMDLEKHPVAKLLQEGKMQICTVANKNDSYVEKFRGVVYHPVWSPLDYPTNNRSYALYLAKEFCEI